MGSHEKDHFVRTQTKLRFNVLERRSIFEGHLNNSLGVLWGHVLIPRSFGVDDADRSVDANAEAVAFRPVAWPILTGKVKLLHPLFEVVPCLEPDRRFNAVGPEADEQVAGQMTDAKLSRHDRRREFFGIGHE